MKNPLIWILLLLIPFAGCVTDRDYKNVGKLKPLSLERYDVSGIDAIVPVPEIEGSDTDIRNLPAKDYLGYHTGWLIAAEGLEEEKFQDFFSKRREDYSEDGIEFQMGFRFDDDAGFGACVPITDDGYFLTVGHNLELSNTYVVYVTSSEERSFMVADECRVVHNFDQVDLAIIKTEFDTPRYLDIRTEPLREKDVLFGGNTFLSQCAAGEYMYAETLKREIQGEKVQREYNWTTIPSLPGDSGSPVVDTNGKLCGVMVFGFVPPSWIPLLDPGSSMVVLDRDAIMDTIARDRKNTESNSKAVTD